MTIVLVVGLLGGLAMASVAIARRTQSSYPTFLTSTNPSTLTFSIYQFNANGGPGPDLTRSIERLPAVTRVSTVFVPSIAPLDADGAPNLSVISQTLAIGSTNGEFVNQDRLALVRGRLADPRSTTEFNMTATAAKMLGVRVGQSIRFGLYLRSQQGEPGFGTPRVPPAIAIRLRLVGVSEMNTQIVQDDVDNAYGFIFLTPATISETLRYEPASAALYAVQLRRGATSTTAIEQQLIGLVPRGYTYQFHVTSQVTTEIELAIKPESIAIGAFGAIAALVCLALAVQAMARRLRSGEEDRAIMRALGATPWETVADGLFAVVAAILVGSIAAVAIAIGLSPLGPIGPVRAVYPLRGIAFDWTVLATGPAVLVVVLVSFAMAFATRMMASRTGSHRQPRRRRSAIARAARASGIPISGVVGTHFALEPDRSRAAVPTRSVIAGAVVAVGLVVTTLTFASGFSTLVSHPRLYGWNWDFALNPTNDVPPVALSLLSKDRDVAAWSDANYTDAQIDGQTVPIILENVGAAVAPPILSGHGLQANDQIVLGAATMSELGLHVGDSVTFSYGSRQSAPAYVPPTRLTIVGTATFPAIGYSSFVSQHTSMGTGALLPSGVQPAAFLNAMKNKDPNLNGPELVFVRLRNGVSRADGLASLVGITDAANRAFHDDPMAAGDEVGILSVQRPAQIVNYRTIGSTPTFLAVALAIGAVVALGLTLGASVRRRRRDLALLKTLGFTRRQVVEAIAWQATIDSVVGIGLGIPLGVICGRQLWTAFANTIYAVPDPTVPALSVVAVGIGALVFANLAAVLPARAAARTPAGLTLRTE